jgi:hypothetical protein
VAWTLGPAMGASDVTATLKGDRGTLLTFVQQLDPQSLTQTAVPQLLFRRSGLVLLRR